MLVRTLKRGPLYLEELKMHLFIGADKISLKLLMNSRPLEFSQNHASQIAAGTLPDYTIHIMYIIYMYVIIGYKFSIPLL